MSKVVREYRQRALEREAQLRDVIKEIKASEIFNDAFKRQRVEQEEAKFRADLASLQAQAGPAFEAERKRIEKRLADKAAARAQQRRELYGDQVLMSLWRDEAAVLEPEKLVSWAAEGAGEWESGLRRELARIELMRREKEKASEDVLRAEYALRSMAPAEDAEIRDLEIELHELRDPAALVAALDIPAEKAAFAVKYGFRPENVVLTQ